MVSDLMISSTLLWCEGEICFLKKLFFGFWSLPKLAVYIGYLYWTVATSHSQPHDHKGKQLIPTEYCVASSFWILCFVFSRLITSTLQPKACVLSMC